MFSFLTSTISYFSRTTLFRHSRTLAKNILLQIISFSILIWLVSVAYAAYTTIAPSSITAGQPVSVALMQQIKDNLDDLNTRVSASSGIPTWAIMAYNLSSCPSGWIAANGTSGTPDLRGEFIRGLDSGRGVDAGRVLSSAQVDILKSHMHVLPSNLAVFWGPTIIFASAYGDTGGTTSNGITGDTGGNETRPRNVALLYCQKQ